MDSENWVRIDNRRKKSEMVAPMRVMTRFVPGMPEYHAARAAELQAGSPKRGNSPRVVAQRQHPTVSTALTRKGELERSVGELESDIQRHLEFLRSMDKVLEVVGAENAQMERQMGTEETKMKFLTEREKQLQQELADAREAVMEEKKETLEKCQSELRAEKETGYVLDMEIETSGEDLGQATKLREEQQRNLETASKKLSAQEDEVEKLKKMTDGELENMENEMTEKRESMDIKIERIKENINLINGKIKETLLNCEANEIIAAIPPRVRLLAAPLMRRICRSSLLH